MSEERAIYIVNTPTEKQTAYVAALLGELHRPTVMPSDRPSRR